ncbi:aminotransferase class I/II-fold pyridoxal phosphate-dependent enzyme [Deinococcus radiomollis]|uniref:aminotransferase class I/II-fold pyridoxal phosphate-dependent enzyme n=1 Tax=Deinococcus radiomollis TaxID=468916 RepID=UPI003891A8BB
MTKATTAWASKRAAAVPGSVFTLMNGAVAQARAAGHRIIDLSIGSSDQSPPEVALEAVRQATLDPFANRYPLFSDTAPLRHSAAAYMARRFGVTLDPETQILPLIGAQEGLAHLLLATTDPGDTLLLPDPCYPPYLGAAAVAGLKVHTLPLLPEYTFLPVLEDVPAGLSPRALLLNYPNNPTSAVASLDFFRAASDWCAARGTLLIHDHPYAELSYAGAEAADVAPSALQAATNSSFEGIVELHSLSKSHHMGGYRVGFAVGDAEVIAALSRVKGAVDFHPWLGIQAAAAAALATVPAGLEVFRSRRDALVPALHALGWQAEWPQASMYVWARPLDEQGRGVQDSVAYAVRAARQTGVALAPGRAFGANGEGYVRFALVQPPELLLEAVRRLADVELEE